MKKILFITLIITNILSAQKQIENLAPPIKKTITLSGTFGELRLNHFHSGIDIRTNGKEGMPIYASENGFVSRIRVLLESYGKVLYIDHPNGYTTVYGHLQKFNTPIQKFVKDYQYNNKTFLFSLNLKPNELKIKKGQLIGYSGNTGNSYAPHLHYEVLETKTQKAINPLLSKIKIKDKKNPIIKGIYLYPLSKFSTINKVDSIFKVSLKKQKKYWISKDTIEICGKIGFGVSSIDLFNNGRNKNGVYAIDIKIDSTLCYSQKMNKISLKKMKYINTHTDFKYWKKYNIKIEKSFINPRNKLAIYQKTKKQAVIFTEPNKLYKVHFIIKDFHQNETKATLFLKGIKHRVIKEKQVKIGIDIPQNNKQFTYKNEDIEIYFSKNNFFNDTFFTYQKKDNIHYVHNTYTALQKPIKIKFDISKYPKNIREKLLVMSVNELFDMNPLGGIIHKDKLVLTTKNLGKMKLICDTIVPTITPLNIKMDKNMTKEKFIKLRVEDDLSGISKIVAYLNKKWILLEYDSKTGNLFYDFNDIPLKKGKHMLKVLITDTKNNTAVLQLPFYK